MALRLVQLLSPLCQPLAGDHTLYAEYLGEHGTGLHHVSPTVIAHAEFDVMLPELEKRGLGFSQRADISDAISYCRRRS